MWYSDVYRRHLCDMHIDDWDARFLSEFSPERYLEALRVAKVQNTMLYFQSHVGLCYYPTQSGRMHKAFRGREDAMARLARMCRENGIFVTGYYSLIYNTWAHDNHPAWRMVYPNGVSKRCGGKDAEPGAFSSASASRYGLCCPNNAEYRAFVFRQLAEINAYFEFDGMFFDMLFWPHMCYCESCRARWVREVGDVPMPETEDWSDPQWQLHIEKRNVWMGEFAAAVAAEMRRLRPGVSVEHNMAYAVVKNPTACNGEAVNASADYAGGDLYGGILQQSLACKLYRNLTREQPFEYMVSRCTPNLSAHTVTKSADELRTAMFLTAAHHGATLWIDAIDPVGTLDARVYSRFGEVQGELIPYEKYFTGEMVEDVGVYFSLGSKFKLDAYRACNTDGCTRAVETMIHRKIPVGVTGHFHTLSGYRALLAPLLTDADAADAERLLAYAHAGGTLYLSGAECAPLLGALGIQKSGYTGGNHVYAAPVEGVDFGWFTPAYPLAFPKMQAPIVTCTRGEVLATLTLPYSEKNEARFASIHSDPPGVATGHPALIKISYGEGLVIWSALPLELSEREEYRDILLSLLPLDLLTVQGDTADDVELVSFRNANGFTVSAVDISARQVARHVARFALCVRTESPPRAVLHLPDAREIPFTYDGEAVRFTVDGFRIFTMYQIVMD